MYTVTCKPGKTCAAKRVVDEAATIKIVPHILDAYAMAAMPARYAVERQRWGEAAALTLPQQREFAWSLFPHAEAALVFARALGAARSGNIHAARKDLDRLQELRANLIKANSEGTWQEYWVSQIQNHRQMVTAWIALYTRQARRSFANAACRCRSRGLYRVGSRDAGACYLRATAPGGDVAGDE